MQRVDLPWIGQASDQGAALAESLASAEADLAGVALVGTLAVNRPALLKGRGPGGRDIQRVIRRPTSASWLLSLARLLLCR
eukprot:1765384-Lingulodinium_polyedra.AAC.1